MIEHLEDDDVRPLRVDPDGVVYKTVAELPGADEKAARDAGTVPVTEREPRQVAREAELRRPAAPVTVIVSRGPWPGRAVAAWLGYRGIEVIKPHPPEQQDYVVVLRFDTEEQPVAWKQWDERREHLERLRPLHAEPERFVVTDMEGWFAVPSPQALPPPRWKMALVIWSAIFLMIVVIDALFGDWLDGDPELAPDPADHGGDGLAHDLGIMPVVTRFLRGWLHSRR